MEKEKERLKGRMWWREIMMMGVGGGIGGGVFKGRGGVYEDFGLEGSGGG